MIYANAGHVPGLLFGPDGAVQWLEKGGTPVGLLAEAEYESEGVVLEPGGAVVLCSDGVTEALNAEEEELGTDGLARIVQQNVGATAQGIVDAVREELSGFLENGTPTDDTTLIVIKRGA